MHEIFNMLLAVFDRAALMLYLPVLSHPYPPVSRTVAQVGALPKRIARRYRHFLAVRPVQHWSGVPVEGSLVNVRIIAVMSGGILFGPWVGIITGVIAGIHRYLIDIGGVTAIPCFITSILAGCISGWINLKIPQSTALARRYSRRHVV